jgi:hypothetical protein
MPSSAAYGSGVWYRRLMKRRLLSLAMASIILMMVVPPVFNTCDKWDKGTELPLVGHDTETTLMMAALETGLGLAVAWSSVRLLSWLAAMLLLHATEIAAVHGRRGFPATEYLLLLFSPPWRIVSLRI